MNTAEEELWRLRQTIEVLIRKITEMGEKLDRIAGTNGTKPEQNPGYGRLSDR